MHQAPVSTLSDDIVSRLYRRALKDASLEDPQLSEPRFADTIRRSVEHRFPGAAPDGPALRRYLDTLHLADLALACACDEGNEPAWERFILELRPALYRAGRAITGEETTGRDLADSIYAELYGVGRGARPSTERRSLFRYYHGRSTLATWLRAILAQRYVDQIREARRTVAVDDQELERTARAGDDRHPEPDPDRARHLGLLRTALRGALGTLAAKDRLRLGCYYTQGMTLAAIGRQLDEHEATVSRRLAGARAEIRGALGTLAAKDRLRLGCYYTQGMTLAAIGRQLDEHEATVSRRLAGARAEIRGALERALAHEGLTAAEIRVCLEHAVEDWPFDLTAELQEAAGASFS